ncbi:hypothetical protein [Lactobacillus sp. Sy-1]|uniref:hypothetical protein n=1 Tax=Lactobacillus sp. Sy-1 TaxID=2109645 RepID=UPI001C5AF0A4|nr:hypothetical protein [Lactobacillus sp. Sy-1]MBW1606462.1 hypothetical protein [Lactobacillus sp. Sy-1]
MIILAKNGIPGHGRKGAVSHRKQAYNPQNKQFVKFNTETGRFMGNKSTPFKGVTKKK